MFDPEDLARGVLEEFAGRHVVQPWEDAESEWRKNPAKFRPDLADRFLAGDPSVAIEVAARASQLTERARALPPRKVRRTRTGRNLDNRRACDRERYARQPDKARAKSARYLSMHLETERARKRAYYHASKGPNGK